MRFILKLNHPYLGELGITNKNQLYNNGQIISNPHITVKDAESELINFIHSKLDEKENTLFLELKHLQDVKNSRLVEFEVVE